MATESPIRILEKTDRWPTLKQHTRYRRPPSAEVAATGDSGKFFQDQNLNSHEDDVIPNRSGSAPPSMEGSIAALEGMFYKKVTVSSLEDPPSSLHGGSSRAIPYQPNRTNTGLPSHEEEPGDDQFLDGSRDLSLEPNNYESEVNAATISDASGVSQAGKLLYQQNEPLIPSNNTIPQDSSGDEVEGSYYPPMNNPVITHPYAFHYSASSASASEAQPTFQPPLFNPTASYMTPSNQYYPNMQQQSGFFPNHYNVPYNYSSAYIAGYPHQGSVPFPFSGGSFPNSGISDSDNVNESDPQSLMMKFYGQLRAPVQSHYPVQYFQPGKENVPSQHSTGGSSFADPLPHLTAPYVVSPVGDASPENYFGGRSSHSPAGNFRRSGGFQSQNWNDIHSRSLLEDLKSGKGPRFELADIVGHVYEFSVDQHGSRFIQQQLERCSDEEKASVFEEVVPYASKLMTDVFGNYVIQKLFEHGSPEQRENLARQLEGQILPLSFQMYGCRVIQKALEVIDLEQKGRLVKELDGNVIRCVRDQNGNHVIQKCLESIPADKIGFIISSFAGQVPSLSMHPYGCRVIQRVLEHCHDESHIQFIIDEILDTVTELARDKYGNYVTQHVLERGKPSERSKIIEKLSGCVVQLSQHKFASNVVEKCLEYGDSASRDLLIKEIIGHGEKNDNLLMMMKDQYANYVIQKILRKCSAEQREVLLALIREHLTALKKYTYGKHIAARFEQLCGEEMQEGGQQ